jgi:hypothetical protein
MSCVSMQTGRNNSFRSAFVMGKAGRAARDSRPSSTTHDQQQHPGNSPQLPHRASPAGKCNLHMGPAGMALSHSTHTYVRAFGKAASIMPTRSVKSDHDCSGCVVEGACCERSHKHHTTQPGPLWAVHHHLVMHAR